MQCDKKQGEDDRIKVIKVLDELLSNIQNKINEKQIMQQKYNQPRESLGCIN